MSVTNAEVIIKFNNENDTKIAYQKLEEEGFFESEELDAFKMKNQIKCLAEYELPDDCWELSDAPHILKDTGIVFAGMITIENEKSGFSYAEQFQSDGKKLIVTEGYECEKCCEIVSSIQGTHITNDDDLDEWYCNDCAQEILTEMISKTVSDKGLNLNDYSPKGKTMSELQLKNLASMLKKMDPEAGYKIKVADKAIIKISE